MPSKNWSALLAAAWLAPNFALKDISGRTVRLDDFRGKTVLLDFWATWCDDCAQSIPYYEKIQERYRLKGLVVVGIDEGDRAKDVRSFARKNGITYPVLLDSNKSVLDAFRVRGIPSTFLVAGDGKIAGQWIGFDQKTPTDIQKAVDSALSLGRQPPRDSAGSQR